MLVEQESASDDIRLTLELGWVLLRSLAEAGLPTESLRVLRTGYRAILPKDDGLDPMGRRQLELIARRSIDGVRLAAILRQEPNPPAILDEIAVPPNIRAQIADIFRNWLLTVQEFVRLPDVASCWKPGSLEYQFRVAAPLGEGELTLDASEYRGGTLDWYHLRRPRNAKPLGAAGQPSKRRITVLPTPVRFHGMPAARFWAIEDETVSFGDLASGPEDLVRAIVGGFAAVYGDDWLIVPCHLTAGSLARVTSLTVYDDYGKHHNIPAAAVLDGPDRVWRFFEIEGDDGPDAPLRKDRKAPLLVLAPALTDTEEGPPLERVDLLRDQVSNLAWGIERRVLGASGRSVDRDAAAVLLEAAPASEEWSYQAYTPVPQNWIPLVPVQRGEGDTAQVHLRRGRMAVPPPGVPVRQLLPMGRLLDAGPAPSRSGGGHRGCRPAHRPPLSAGARCRRPGPPVDWPPRSDRRLARSGPFHARSPDPSIGGNV